MNPNRRDGLLKVCDGYQPALHYIWHWDHFARCEKITSWLIAHGLIGKRMVDWVLFHHEGSVIKAGAEILRRLDRDEKAKPIIGGRDYLTY